MSEILWITKRMTLAIHSQQLALFGGASGILDEGKLSSALARAKQFYTYQPDASLYELAAAIGWGSVQIKIT